MPTLPTRPTKSLSVGRMHDPSGLIAKVGGRGIVGVETSAQAEAADDQML